MISDVEQGFLPWLMDQVDEQLERNEHGRLVLDGMLREVVSKRMELYNKLDALAASHGLGSRVPSNVVVEKPSDELTAPATTTAVRAA